MTKKDLIQGIGKAAGLNMKQSEGALNAVVDSIKAGMKQGKRVSIPGFGTFFITKRNARKGRNPKTGETIDIAASKVAKFRPGKALKDLFKK